MSQACVMVQPRQEQLFTPGKAQACGQDNSLITSAVRKRKVDPADSPLAQHGPSLLLDEQGKRQRTPPVDRGLAHGDAVVRLAVAPGKAGGAPAAATPGGERPQQLDACQRAHAHASPQQPEGDEEGLFSPLFHLHGCAGADDACAGSAAGLPAGEAARPASGAALLQPAAAPDPAVALSSPPPPRQLAAADNASTDRSTGTSASLADGDACADVASPCLAVTSPAPAAPCGQAAEEEEEAEAEEYLEFDPLLFIKRLPPLERCVAPRRDFLLPKKTRRSKQKTLVLDLDETLVHSTLDGFCRPDFTFPVEVGPHRHLVGVRQRPHLHAFLERVAQLYEVVVFTASQRVYAEQLLNVVDPGRRLVRHRVFRESCVLWEGNYMKDLTVLGRDLAHTIIVDNSPQAFGFQLDNGIPIESWYDDDGDEELLKLIPFLERVAHAEDVRPHIQNRYRLRSLVDAAPDPEAFRCHQRQ